QRPGATPPNPPLPAGVFHVPDPAAIGRPAHFSVHVVLSFIGVFVRLLDGTRAPELPWQAEISSVQRRFGAAVSPRRPAPTRATAAPRGSARGRGAERGAVAGRAWRTPVRDAPSRTGRQRRRPAPRGFAGPAAPPPRP